MPHLKRGGSQAMELSDARWRGDRQRLIDSLRKLPGFDADPEPPVPGVLTRVGARRRMKE